MQGGRWRARTMAGRVDRVGRSRRKRKAPVADWRGILTRVNPEGLRALRILAIELDTTLQALVVEALNDVLLKHGKRAGVTTWQS
jgi:hypothetical protein